MYTSVYPRSLSTIFRFLIYLNGITRPSHLPCYQSDIAPSTSSMSNIFSTTISVLNSIVQARSNFNHNLQTFISMQDFEVYCRDNQYQWYSQNRRKNPIQLSCNSLLLISMSSFLSFIFYRYLYIYIYTYEIKYCCPIPIFKWNTLLSTSICSWLICLH